MIRSIDTQWRTAGAAAKSSSVPVRKNGSPAPPSQEVSRIHNVLAINSASDPDEVQKPVPPSNGSAPVRSIDDNSVHPSSYGTFHNAVLKDAGNAGQLEGVNMPTVSISGAEGTLENDHWFVIGRFVRCCIIGCLISVVAFVLYFLMAKNSTSKD